MPPSELPPPLPSRSTSVAPIPESSPFDPGASPWRQKGNVYRSLFRHIDSYVEGGSASALARLENDAVRQFLQQPFAASGWYDLFPMIALIVQVARLRGIPYFNAVSDLSRMMADADLNGLYRTLLRAVSPGLLAPRLPKIQAQYLNFGSLEILEASAKHCEVERRAHPRLLVHWYLAVVHGFLPCVLACSGANQIRVTWTRPELEGADDAGFEKVRFRFVIHWA